jgi:DNA-binding response OmpR family regulator
MPKSGPKSSTTTRSRSQAASRALRFLIVDDDVDYRQLLRYHLEVEWPDALIDEYQPSSAGPLPASTGLADVDLILLGHPIAGDQEFGFLRRLRGRPDCPPVLLFADEKQSDEFLAVDALKAGAANFFPKARVKHQRLIAAVSAELNFDRPDGTTGLLANHRVLNGERKRRVVAKLYGSDLSSVYLAEAEDDREQIALKVLHHVPDAGGGRLFDRFLQEYEVIARIRHPNVVRIFDLGVADDHAYLAMEYLGAGSLAQRLDRPLPPRIALDCARQIGGALEAIHGAGVLHRDLKPGNVMFRTDGSLALIDFGLAKQMRLHAAITGTGQIFGTPSYMSPEQGHAEPTDERSDLYSFGCILYEMLTGERPFTGSSPMGVIYKHAHAPRPRLNLTLVDFQPLLDRLLAVERLERYQSAGEVLAALDRIDRAR